MLLSWLGDLPALHGPPTRQPPDTHQTSHPRLQPSDDHQDGTPTFCGIRTTPNSQTRQATGASAQASRGAATLCSWQTCVELNLAAGTVSVGHLWQKCQFWPQLGDLDFSKQLFLLAEAIKTQPGSEKLGDHASVSLWRWVLAHRASSPDAPGGPVAVVTVSGHWAKAVGRAVGTWVLRRRALWEEGDDHSILGGKTHI